MAKNYLITGYWGEPHITPENDRGIYAAILGKGRFVLNVGEQFRAEYIGNNTVRMYDGKLIDNGAVAGIPAGEYIDINVPNAGQGMKRRDIIAFQYNKDITTQKESGSFVLVRGEEVSSTTGQIRHPNLTQENLLTDEAVTDQMALWSIVVSGADIGSMVEEFTVLDPLLYKSGTDHQHLLESVAITGTLSVNKGGTGADNAVAARANLGAAAANHSHQASSITSGTLPIERGGTGASTAANARTALGITPANIGAVSKAGDTMTGELKVPSFSVMRSGTGEYNVLKIGLADKMTGFVQQDTANNTLRFIERGTDTTFAEQYNLPRPNTGLTKNETYDILTSKKPVSVAQGGTGAANKFDALVNLGLEIESGIALMSNAMNNGCAVTFERQIFSGIPTVILTTDSPEMGRPYVADVTNTGFTIKLADAISNSGHVHWVAIRTARPTSGV